MRTQWARRVLDCAPMTDENTSPDLATLRQMWDAGDAPRDISRATGIPYSSLYWHAKRLGLKPRRDRTTHDESIAAMRGEGVPVAEICERLSIGKDVVTRTVQRLGLEHRRAATHLRADQHGEFEELWLSTGNVRKLAAHFDVPDHVIYNHRKRRGLPDVLEVRERRVVELYAEDVPVAEIARRLGVSTTCVRETRYRAGVPNRMHRSQANRADIKADLDAGMSGRAVMAKWRTSSRTVASIRQDAS